MVHLAAECVPFARTGGLGEVVRTLAETQAASGAPVAVVMPLHRAVRDAGHALAPVTAPFAVRVGAREEWVRLLATAAHDGGPRTYFVDHPSFADRPGLYGDGGADYPDNAFRYALFSLAALAALPRIAGGAVVVHAHDWHAALAPVYLRTAAAEVGHAHPVATILSVHNAGFQGHFAPEVMPELGLPWSLFDWRRFEWYGRANLLKGGMSFADVVTTVSPTHAAELCTPVGGFGLHEAFAALGDRLVGVLNGIDPHEWDPAADPELPAHFSIDDPSGKRACRAALQRALGLAERADVPLFAFCARLAAQKGLDLLLESGVLDRTDAQFVFLGEGEARYASALTARAGAAPHRIGVQRAFSSAAEHRLLAGADACLVPSVYEPCGLTQMHAQRYGTVPVAHRVGGLADTIVDGETGFLFDAHTPAALADAVERAVAAHADAPRWTRMVAAAMRRDFGWARSASAYQRLYRQVLAGVR